MKNRTLHIDFLFGNILSDCHEIVHISLCYVVIRPNLNKVQFFYIPRGRYAMDPIPISSTIIRLRFVIN